MTLHWHKSKPSLSLTRAWFYLHGHGSSPGQGLNSCPLPVHSLFVLPCFMQSLFLLCQPAPHVTEHSPQADQDPQRTELTEKNPNNYEKKTQVR